MAEILIRNIEMPKTCRRCLEMDIPVRCRVKEQEPVTAVMSGYDRPNDCPLVELPPHGELKNATHIINELERQLEMEKKAERPFSESPPGNAYMRKCRIEVLEWVIRNIKNQPTIVETSK